MSLLDRTCRECDRSFQGGPRAFYCPSCRAERQREQSRRGKARQRQGLTRRLGSIDTCERCRKQYTVEGGLQRFCPECQPVHAQEYDRETSLEFYYQNKGRINPGRNERRRIGLRKCEWCGAEFDHGGTKRLTCSEEHQRLLKNKKYREIYYHRYRNNLKKNKKIDITGEKFDRLTAIKEVEPRGKNRRYLFRCDCGNEIITQMSAVKWGNTRSCGCLHSERVSAANLDDLTGQTFGKLTVLERAPTRGKSLSARWICRCKCGNFSEVQATNLKSGRTKSCGCARRRTLL